MKAMLNISALLLALSGLCPLVNAQQPESGYAAAPPLVTAQVSADHIRFSALTLASKIRLEILSTTGDTLFDSGLRAANLIEWPIQDQVGAQLTDGQFGCLVTLKDLSGHAIARAALEGR